MQDSPLEDIRIGQISHHWAEAQKIKTQYFSKTDSTNNQAKKQAFQDLALSEQLIIYFADHQSSGKGRGQNSWATDQEGSQLLSTWSFMVEQAPQPITAPLLGLALYKAALATWPFLNWNLKAPNDLYIADKKIAGLLIETISQGADFRLLIGLGFNAIQHPPHIQQATNLMTELPRHTPLLAQDWVSFLERILFEFSLALQLSFENTLNSTTCASLVAALNKHPHLTETYISIDADANLKTKNRLISWTDL